MKIVKEVADSIEEMIETEIDFPSNRKNLKKKMSILDIQVWVRKVETEKKSVKNQIYYEFFEKPMSSKFVILKNSATPLSKKRTVLTQEGIRRLKIGPSGVRALPSAAGRNVGGHYFRYFCVRQRSKLRWPLFLVINLFLLLLLSCCSCHRC